MTTLVFLHGSGADKNAYFETMQNIASKFNAQLITFNAPFPHPNKKGKFVWFNKKEINDKDVAQYVKEVPTLFKKNTEETKGRVYKRRSPTNYRLIHFLPPQQTSSSYKKKPLQKTCNGFLAE